MKIEKKREKIGNVDFFASKVFIWEFAAEIQLYQSDSVYDRKFREPNFVSQSATQLHVDWGANRLPGFV